MKKFIDLFKKVGGFQILRQYARGHVLLYALVITVMNGFSKKSLEIVRLSVGNKLLEKLRKKYKKFVEYYLSDEPNSNSRVYNKGSEDKRVVWVCWFQGIEQAPDIVRACYESLCKHITDREIVLLTEENYRDYVQFPKFIEAKVKAGIISRTHMSDLLRLELLKNYGGTWIDATIYLTGEIPGYMLDSQLFLFQNLKPGLDGHCTSISNWFITAEAGNKIIDLILSLLYEYWRQNNGLVDYYIFHDFFQIAIEKYREDWKRVVPVSNATPHILLLRLFDQYDDQVWEAVKGQCPVHKLSYKYDDIKAEIDGTYYRKLLK